MIVVLHSLIFVFTMPKHKILLIDSDQDFAFLTSKLLTRNGYLVLSKTEKKDISTIDIKEALSIVCDFRPHAIVLNYSFLGDHISIACRYIRRHYQSKIILMVDNNLVQDQCNPSDAYIDVFLPKPFQAPALLSAIGESLAISSEAGLQPDMIVP